MARIRLTPDLTRVVEEVIAGDLFQFPTTAARFGSRLAVVNAKFDTGIPPTRRQVRGGPDRPVSVKPLLVGSIRD